MPTTNTPPRPTPEEPPVELVDLLRQYAEDAICYRGAEDWAKPSATVTARKVLEIVRQHAAPPVTPEDLEEIRRRSDAATPGPWRQGMEEDLNPSTLTVVCRKGNHAAVVAQVNHYVGTDADAAFLAHARRDVPRLVEEVERAWVERDRMAKMERDKRVQWLESEQARIAAEIERDTLDAELRATREREAALRELVREYQEAEGDRGPGWGTRQQAAADALLAFPLGREPTAEQAASDAELIAWGLTHGLTAYKRRMPPTSPGGKLAEGWAWCTTHADGTENDRVALVAGPWNALPPLPQNVRNLIARTRPVPGEPTTGGEVG